MNTKDQNKTPDEIPTKKHPHNPDPLKDPAAPGKSNPINPKKDEPNHRH